VQKTAQHDQPDEQWYRQPATEVFALLESGPEGLDESEAAARLATYGPNELNFKRASAFARFVRQFNNPLIYVLLAAAVTTTFLSLFAGEDMMADTYIILGVVVINAVLGFVQEGKAENAIAALQNMMVPECDVLRAGHQQMIPASKLVPGDVVVLNGGDRVPADLRLFRCQDASADESMLTGESLPVTKNIDAIASVNLTPGDQRCMAFSGTFLVRGHALGLVVNTGTHTEFGKIAAMVSHTRAVKTPLQRKIEEFTRVLIIAILSLGAVNFVLGALFGYSMAYSFLASVSLIVAAIPEMLPMIVTAILALAATTMARRNALIRRLPAAETLGCTTVICSDKTGTLTRNEMTVQHIYSGDRHYQVEGDGYSADGTIRHEGEVISSDALDRALVETLKAGTLCNDAEILFEQGVPVLVGDPTEGALKVSAAKASISDEGHRLGEIPFDSELMFMATLHRAGEHNVIYVKGSPERLITFCSRALVADEHQDVVPERILEEVNQMASRALRVIGMAYKQVPADQETLALEDIADLTFVGLQGMMDPPRADAIEAVEQCRRAGIRTIMVTGDHIATARAVARQLGIIIEDDALAIEGARLNDMSDDELHELIDRVSVFARVAPEHKLRIATALQRWEHIVAMTGDGVNDAPALKAANIGISMGKSGTEVSKEASSMILTDDNFSTIVNAVEEGRHVWNNLEKAILYTLPTNGGQALLVMGAVLLAPFVPLFATRLPLEPVQILWVNLFDSVFLTIPLMMEPKRHNILANPPRDPQTKIANAMFLQRVIVMGLAIAVPGFAVYYYFGSPAVVDGELVNPLLLTQAQTAAFWAALFTHLGFVVSARSIFDSAFTFSPFSNRWLLAGIALSIALHVVVTFVPVVAGVFRCAVFPTEWWGPILLCLLSGFVMLEVDKALRRMLARRDTDGLRPAST